MYKLTIFITEEDIQRGAPKRHFFCPIAIALNRYFGTGLEAAVHEEDAIILGQGKPYSFRMIAGEDAWRFVNAFDAKKKVLPQAVHFYFSPR